MIQEAIQTAGQVVHNHWAGGISGGALVHFLHIAWPWLKANNGLRGVWVVVWGTKPPSKWAPSEWDTKIPPPPPLSVVANNAPTEPPKP